MSEVGDWIYVRSRVWVWNEPAFNECGGRAPHPTCPSPEKSLKLISSRLLLAALLTAVGCSSPSTPSATSTGGSGGAAGSTGSGGSGGAAMTGSVSSSSAGGGSASSTS